MSETRPHDPLAFRGRVDMVRVESEALRENPLGDPHVRELPVYVPPGAEPGGLPALFVLAAYTGRGQGYLETHPWKRGVVWRYDRAVAAGEAAPAILALPDCFTALGGSQYVNSTAVGRYEDHVADELVPLVGERYGARATGVVGFSSGGFGALHLCMRRPGLFAACGSISGDVAWDVMFPGEFYACLRGLVPYDMDPARFLAEFRAAPDLSGDRHAVISVLAMAACYSPNPASELGFDLPFDLATGARREDVWARWLEFDPLHAVADHAAALKGLSLLHLECGLADEFHLQWGLRRLSARLNELGVPHHHEEHPGGHRGIGERFDPLLGELAAALRA